MFTFCVVLCAFTKVNVAFKAAFISNQFYTTEVRPGPNLSPSSTMTALVYSKMQTVKSL